MAVYLSPVGGVAAQFFDNNGTPLAGGLIYTYAAGTSTPATTYTSSSGIIAHSNPIVLDASGRVPTGEIWLSNVLAYKFVIKTDQDVLIASYDNISGINSNFASTSQQEIQTATAGQTLFTLTTMTYQPATNNLAVYVDGVNQYGPGAQYAYVETSSTEVTFVSGLHVGASVKFTTATPVASAVFNAENVAYDPPFFGAVSTNVENKLAQTVSVKDFGAVGDGVTDDTAAIQAAIDSGKPLNWLNGTYKITSELVFSVANSLYWICEDAIISYEPASHTYSCMTISLPTGQHQIIGGLTVNVNQNANVGLKFIPETNGTDEPDLLLEDVRINEPYRVLGFNDGDALFIVGSFQNVNIVRPVIKDCFMATGAGIAGTYGIFGITVSRNGNYSPKYTSISDVWIENVYSDDPTYLSDQDGIRIFSRYGGSGTGGLNNANTFTVNGGVIKNVRGRSLKAQTENGIVNGLSLYRTKAAFGGNAGKLTQNADIEMQTGGCTVSNIEFQYEDFVPIRVVRCIQADETVRWASPQIVNNIRGVVSGSYSPSTVVAFSALTTTTAFESQFIASNVNVVSETPLVQIFGINTLGSTSSAIINAAFSNAICPVDSRCVETSANPTSKKVTLSNVTNTSGTIVPVFTYLTGLVLESINLFGFYETNKNAPSLRISTPVVLSDNTNFYILERTSTTQIVNLPDPTITLNRLLIFKNLGSVAVDSNASNIVPFGSTTAGTSIFGSGTAGTWVSMISDGTNWVIMQKG